MPVEIVPLWRLYDPFYALLLALGMVATIASVTYLFARNWQRSTREHNRRVLSLVAEVLVSVGVIGLVTFAARARIDYDIRQTDQAEEELQRQLNAALIDFTMAHCIRPGTPVPPTKEMGTIYESCGFGPKLMRPRDEFVDWWSARDRLREMSVVPDIKPALSLTYASLAARVDAVIHAQSEVDMSKHKKMLVESNASWLVVAVCVFLATIGVALKWVRAVLDIKAIRHDAG